MKTIHFQRNSWKVNIESLFLDFKRSVLINHILPLHNFGLTPVFPALFKYNWNQIFLMREELVDVKKKLYTPFILENVVAITLFTHWKHHFGAHRVLFLLF